MKIKDENTWLVQFDLHVEWIDMAGWKTQRWALSNVVFPINKAQLRTSTYQLPLDLFKDERADYRFNLNAKEPKLFFIFNLDDDEVLKPIKLTASQTCAASFHDGEGQIFSIPMPLAVQAWMEAFMGRHGEADDGRRKKRKGGKAHG